MSGAAERNDHTERGKKEQEPEHDGGLQAHGKEVEDKTGLLPGIEGRVGRDQAHNARGCPHYTAVRVLGQKTGEHLRQSTESSGEQVQFQEVCGAVRLLDGAAEKVKAQAVHEQMPWPGTIMQKLEGNQLPDAAGKQSGAAQTENLGQVDTAMHQESRLQEEDDRQTYQQIEGGGTTEFHRLPSHVWTVSQHDEGKLDAAGCFFNGHFDVGRLFAASPQGSSVCREASIQLRQLVTHERDKRFQGLCAEVKTAPGCGEQLRQRARAAQPQGAFVVAQRPGLVQFRVGPDL